MTWGSGDNGGGGGVVVTVVVRLLLMGIKGRGSDNAVG